MDWRYDSVPLVIVFAKYDISVTTAIRDASGFFLKRKDDKIRSYGETIANKDFRAKLDTSLLAKIIRWLTSSVSTFPSIILPRNPAFIDTSSTEIQGYNCEADRGYGQRNSE